MIKKSVASSIPLLGTDILGDWHFKGLEKSCHKEACFVFVFINPAFPHFQKISRRSLKMYIAKPSLRISFSYKCEAS